MLGLITTDIELMCPAAIDGSFFVVVLSPFRFAASRPQ